jgi:purine-binding chemotaxis protein CheW
MRDVVEEVQLLTFRLDGAEFAFNILEVERVLRHQPPEALPGAPPFIKGMLPYGDGVIPVLDLRERLGAPAPLDDATRIVVVQLGSGRVGVVVDAVREVARVPASRVAPPPPALHGPSAAMLAGVVRWNERTIIVLAPAKLLTSSERLALKDLLAEVHR